MFHELKELVGHTVTAIDGEIGHIRTFLFDDRSWNVRFLVVEVKHWLTDREVVLPTAAVERPDWNQRICRVRLTKQQVGESPDVDTEKPVSRQQEIAMKEYFGAFGCWINREFGFSSLPAYAEFPVHTPEDHGLRSTSHLLGYEVLVPKGGKCWLEGFVLDEDLWRLSYLDIKSEDWLSSRSLLIPTRWVEDVCWATHQISVRNDAEPAGNTSSRMAETGTQSETTSWPDR